MSTERGCGILGRSDKQDSREHVCITQARRYVRPRLRALENYLIPAISVDPTRLPPPYILSPYPLAPILFDHCELRLYSAAFPTFTPTKPLIYYPQLLLVCSPPSLLFLPFLIFFRQRTFTYVLFSISHAPVHGKSDFCVGSNSYIRIYTKSGSGAVYSFDPVGSYERETCRAAGAAQSLVQPFLDNQIYFKNQMPPLGGVHPQHLPLKEVLSLVIDSFTGATERHIEVGDGLEIYIVLGSKRSTTDIEGIPEVKQVQGTFVGQEEGEKIYILRKELKKD